MKERDYMLATNIARLMLAGDALRMVSTSYDDDGEFVDLGITEENLKGLQDRVFIAQERCFKLMGEVET